MKKLFFGLLILMFCVNLNAQNKSSNSPTVQASSEDVIKMRAERSTKYLTSRFELDEAQQVKLMKIQTRIQKNYLEILPFKKSEPEVFHDKQLALAKSADAEILKILKEEQQEEYNSMIAERNEQALRRARKIQNTTKPE